jgi:hypothetical protein
MISHPSHCYENLRSHIVVTVCRLSEGIRIGSMLTTFVATLHAVISGRKKEFKGTPPSHTGSDTKC